MRRLCAGGEKAGVRQKERSQGGHRNRLYWWAGVRAIPLQAAVTANATFNLMPRSRVDGRVFCLGLSVPHLPWGLKGRQKKPNPSLGS